MHEPMHHVIHHTMTVIYSTLKHLYIQKPKEKRARNRGILSKIKTRQWFVTNSSIAAVWTALRIYYSPSILPGAYPLFSFGSPSPWQVQLPAHQLLEQKVRCTTHGLGPTSFKFNSSCNHTLSKANKERQKK